MIFTGRLYCLILLLVCSCKSGKNIAEKAPQPLRQTEQTEQISKSAAKPAQAAPAARPAEWLIVTAKLDFDPTLLAQNPDLVWTGQPVVLGGVQYLRVRVQRPGAAAWLNTLNGVLGVAPEAQRELYQRGAQRGVQRGVQRGEAP